MAWAVFLLVCAITSVIGQDANPTDSVGSQTFIVGAIEHPVYLKKKEDGSYEGFDQDVLNEISKLIGVDFRIKPPDDGRYGMEVDGRWNGMVGELIERKIDMAMGLYITTERERVIDLSKPLMEEHVEMLVKKLPMMDQADWWALTYGIMSNEVWVVICVSFFLVAIVLFVIIRVSPYESRAYSAEVGEASRLSTFGHSLWICFSAMSWQGVDYSPRSFSGRFLFVFFFGFIVWTIILCTGSIAGFFLTNPAAVSVRAPVESWDDLAATDGIRPVLVSGGGSERFFKESKVPMYRRIYDKAIKVSSSEEGLKRARLGVAAYICMSSIARYHSNQKPCDLMSIHDAQGIVGRRSMGIGLPIGSPLRTEVSLAILQLREDGTIHRLYQKWTARQGQCANAEFSGPSAKQQQPALHYHQLGVRDMLPIFVELVVAAILSLCIMGAEVVWDKRRSKATRKASTPDKTTGACEDTNI
ncbi:glutamate receptor ionotropic, kainate 2-like [Branchiostoma floridae]|uniref:Glutamate receptor ionotropic, kainate 2-like n=1 Tax=Branchiostoma floridae TaxID=7739 RepID=A0A9J7KPA1_BRAFL|nr:glutamate receptor ionotropic, kainate 2-like [Branchiostoma floridae]